MSPDGAPVDGDDAGGDVNAAGADGGAGEGVGTGGADGNAGTGNADGDRPRVAAFRPADERAKRARRVLTELGVEPVIDPMLSVEPTGATPREAAFVVLTSKTGAELLDAAGWDPGGATVCAIGERTAGALRDAGYRVDLVPGEYSSAGLVAALSDRVDGDRVEVARSDHGSATLLDGLAEAGADVNETVLYRLERPADAGDAAELAASGDLSGALFTSSLTVEHFLAAAADRGVREEAVEGLGPAVVGAIGDPTRRTAADGGIDVDVVPGTATFEALARAAVERIDGRR